ncbi:hypothetical protein GIB67_016542 [Kingdonia uniflora]|uniref:Inhibitor I9 domain-containing protein n=1 Tax=Kingdonia uniflora TaxID=39325 RepID=A0A7J7NQY1_9MAGN|nr:hypothetical protein GIB67_016542 [Kingdonia uniflora]
MPKAFSIHYHWYSAILDLLKTDSDKVSTSVPPELFYTYNHAIHGFSVDFSPEKLEALKKMPGCITAYPDHTLYVDTTRIIDFLSLNKAGGLWPVSNCGTDAIIGVIDSGVWPESASFRDEMREIPRRNEMGHGTHTTLIAVRNYVRGVSHFGYAMSITRGAAPCDGVDIILISMSFRGALPYEDPISIISFAAMEKGILVSSLAENRDTLTLDNGKTIIGWSLFLGRALLNASVVYNETITGCNLPALLLESANNAIVVCSDGPRINNQISTFIESTVTRDIFFSTDEREVHCILGVTIKPIDAPTVINYAKSTIDSKATIKFRQTVVRRRAKRAPQIPEYSF